MHLRNTLLLALLCAALGGYLYFVELPREPNSEGIQNALDFDVANVTHIELEHPGRKVVLERTEDGWTMLEPVEDLADERAIDNLLEAAHGCQITRTLDAVDNLATFGLDHASATLRLRLGDQELPALRIGKNAPVGGSTYLNREGDETVHLTPSTFATRIDLKSNDLRDKRVLRFDQGAVQSITLARPSGDITLAMDDSGIWKITAPTAHDVDQSTVTSLLSTLLSIRATNFIDEAPDLRPYGLDKPALRIKVGLADGVAASIDIGNERQGKLRIRSNRGATIYEVASWLRENLDQDLNHFRDKSICNFAPDDLAELRITTEGGETLNLSSRDGGDWVAPGRDGNVNGEAVQELIRELAALQGFEIAADSPDDLVALGLEPPKRTIEALSQDGAALATVVIGSHTTVGAQTEYTAMRQGADVVMHLREFVFDRLNRPIVELVSLPAASEGSAPPVPDSGAGDGVDENTLDDTAAASEQG